MTTQSHLKNKKSLLQNQRFLFGLTFVISAGFIIIASLFFTPVRNFLHGTASLIGMSKNITAKAETITGTIFSDIPATHKNAVAIQYLKKTHLIQGYSDDSFKPENPITRAELLKVIVTAMNSKPSLFTNSNCFKDVDNEWFSPSVCFAKTKGWTEGYSDKTFHPNENIKKVEALKIIMTAFQIKTANIESPTTFTDVKSDQWFAPYVATAQKAGLLEENPQTDQYNPNSETTRAQAAEVLYRAMQKYLPIL